jgi:cytochrome c peroxidase
MAGHIARLILRRATLLGRGTGMTIGLVFVLPSLLLASGAASTELLQYSGLEIRTILRHGPWPPAVPRDSSNRVSGEPRAIALGRRLFFDPRLSANGTVACANCHVPEKTWSDGRTRAVGLAPLDRNTPSIVNVGLARWFSWDGGADSVWSQALRAMLHSNEMGTSAARVSRAVAGDPSFACQYAAAFGHAPTSRSDDDVLVDAAKAIAAFVETLVSGRTEFDEFRDALACGDREAAARYPLAAQRGLRIFVGKGNCSVCHFGPSFTNGEFHDVGVPFMAATGRVDPGRYEGIKRLRADPYNLLGKHNDDTSGITATKTRHVDLQQVAFGQFKTPSLRNVELTAPYMHNGRFATLQEVVLHYSNLDPERLHADGEQLLQPLKLSDGEVDDLLAFLRTLTDSRSTAPLAEPQPIAGCAP